MLIDTMKPREMLDELQKDAKELNDMNVRFIYNGGARHLRRTGAKFPAYISKEQQTKRGNRYICSFLFRKRGDVFSNKILETHLCLFQTKEGLTCASIAYSSKFDKEILYVYRPHVFMRYKERLGLNLDGIELIRYFNRRSADCVLHDDYKHKEGDIENDIMLTITDGALFGTRSEVDGCICNTINTFIANDTMQDGYKSKFNHTHNQAMDEIKETWELFESKNKYKFNGIKRKE